MLFIESHFYLAGFTDKVAVLGKDFSYEAKASRNTLMIFEIGSKPQVTFHLMIYELAYIAVPSQNVQSDAVFKAQMAKMKKDNPKVEEVEVGIKVLEEAVCSEEMTEMPKIIK